MSFVFQSGASSCPSAVADRVSVASGAALGRWARWLCHLFAIWGVLTLLSAGNAAAASPGAAGDAAAGDADVPAPMCDPDGASVAAKDDIPEVDRGHFEALPCEAQLWISGWRLDAPEFGWHAASIHDTDPTIPPHSAGPPRLRYDAAHPLSDPFPERAEPLSATFFRGEGLAQRSGHARDLYRPPVVRT